jgi:lactate permease
MWSQVYNPFGSAVISTIVAALPIICLMGLIAFAKMQAHIAAGDARRRL